MLCKRKIFVIRADIKILCRTADKNISERALSKLIADLPRYMLKSVGVVNIKRLFTAFTVVNAQLVFCISTEYIEISEGLFAEVVEHTARNLL